MSQPPPSFDPGQSASFELDAQSGDRSRQNLPGHSDRRIAVGGNVEGSAVVSGDGNTVVVGGNYVQAPTIPRSSTEQKLLNQVKAEVASRLQQSLHNAVFINLIKDAQPRQVVRLWDAEVKIGATPPQALPEDTTILQVFNRPDIAGRLLILGKPGAGKTTTQLELAKALCDRCEQQADHPIPVLFNLSTWKETNQSIADWLVAELNSKYGLRRDLGVQWLNEFKLSPFLDGLDELDPQRQLPCIHAINQFISGESAPSYLIVGSRFEEYERLGAQLQLNGAIYLKELTDRQIQDYLASANQSVLWTVIAKDEALLELVRYPLLLSMAVLAYQGEAQLEWQSLKSSEARLEHLLDAYVRRMLEQSTSSPIAKQKKLKSYSPRQTRLWLIWLAQQMERESQTEFLIERMQPSWLSTEALQRVYRSRVLLICKLIFGLLAFLIGGMSFGLVVGLAFGLGIWWGVERFELSYLDTVSVTESLKWSMIDAKRNAIFGISLALILVLIIGLGSVAIIGFFNGLITVLLWALLGFGLSFGLLFGLVGGLRGAEISLKDAPNQGIRRTLYYGIIQMVVTGLFYGLCDRLVNTNSLLLNLINGLFMGLFFSTYGGIDDKSKNNFSNFKNLLANTLRGNSNGPLGNCTKHFVLRITLSQKAFVPWNYARFLNHCTDRLLLQRVGGRYRFIHKLLQDHFAAMRFEKP